KRLFRWRKKLASGWPFTQMTRLFLYWAYHGLFLQRQTYKRYSMLLTIPTMALHSVRALLGSEVIMTYREWQKGWDIKFISCISEVLNGSQMICSSSLITLEGMWICMLSSKRFCRSNKQENPQEELMYECLCVPTTVIKCSTISAKSLFRDIRRLAGSGG